MADYNGAIISTPPIAGTWGLAGSIIGGGSATTTYWLVGGLIAGVWAPPQRIQKATAPTAADWVGVPVPSPFFVLGQVP